MAFRAGLTGFELSGYLGYPAFLAGGLLVSGFWALLLAMSEAFLSLGVISLYGGAALSGIHGTP